MEQGLILALLYSANHYLFDKYPYDPQKSNDIHKSKQEVIKQQSSAYNKQRFPTGCSADDIMGVCSRGMYVCIT